MSKTCTNCIDGESKSGKVVMSEWTYEAQQARHERQMKRMWALLLIAVTMLFASNVGWLIYESQFDTYTYDYCQDGDGQNNINYGSQGDLLNEPTTESQSQKEEVW